MKTIPIFSFLKKKWLRLYHRLLSHTRFQTRLLIVFLAVGLPIFSCIILISSLALQRINGNLMIKSQQTELRKTSSQIQLIMNDAETISNDILSNPSVQKMLLEHLRGDAYPSDADTSYYISSFLASRSYISNVVLTGKDRTLYSTAEADTSISSFENIRKKWWYSRLTSLRHPYAWFFLSDRKSGRPPVLNNGTPQENNLILFTRPIYNLSRQDQLLGYMMIYLDSSYLKNIWNDISWGQTSNFLIYNSSHQLIASNSTGSNYTPVLDHISLSELISHGMILPYQGKRFIINALKLGRDGHIAVMITPCNEVNSTSRFFRLIILIIVSTLIVVLLISSVIAVRYIARPITNLSHIMDSYHGDSLTGLPMAKGRGTTTENYARRQDEVGQIYRSYNQMLQRINHLIEDNYVKDLEKKDADLAILQSQINPHFLYNTLDSINWLALAHDETEISEMVMALSDMFRLSLMKNSSSMIELGQEFQYIQSYLTLQKVRYGKRLRYHFDIPEDLPKLYIPRFILQPVVENALKYGIDRSEKGGTIRIHMNITSDLTISVTNPGTDIDLEKMRRMLEFYPDNGNIMDFQKGGYGIQNINRRIKLLCGKNYGLSYQKSRRSTTCTLTLPIRETLQ